MQNNPNIYSYTNTTLHTIKGVRVCKYNNTIHIHSYIYHSFTECIVLYCIVTGLNRKNTWYKI